MLLIDIDDQDKFWVWDGRTQRYRDKETGKFLSKEAVRFQSEKRVEFIQQNLRQDLKRLLAGETSLIDFSVNIAEKIKTLHAQQYMLGRGGYANTRNEEFLHLGRELKELHYPALKRFVEQLRDGQLSEAQAYQRLNLFISATKSSFAYGEKMAAVGAGKVWARRYLGIAEHCPDCVAYAAMGIVPASEVVPPATNCACGGNCKCYVKYGDTKQELV